MSNQLHGGAMLPRFLCTRAPPGKFSNSGINFLAPALGCHSVVPGRPFSTQVHRNFIDMDKAYLRNAINSEELHITFRYVSEKLRMDRDFNFCRRMSERIDDGLVRMRGNFEKELKKRNKRNAKTDPKETSADALPEINIELYMDGKDERLTDITFAEMLQNISCGLKLRVIDKNFQIVFNQPWITNLVLPNSIMAGYLVYPSKLELQFASREHCLGSWYTAKMPTSGDLHKDAEWQPCGEGLSFEVPNKVKGLYLKVIVTPRNEQGIEGPPTEHIAKWPVQDGPGICPFELRQHSTPNKLSKPDELRVVTYNLLADLYADSDYSRGTLFPYCLPYALEIDYRKQLFIKELLGYNADLLCLQEVDLKVFEYDLKAVLGAHNFRGIMAQKGSSAEGCAIFYSEDRFEYINHYVLHLGSNLTTLPLFAPLWNKIKCNPRLATRICDRTTTLELCLLKIKNTDRYILAANTHLYFHPDADHIRLLQIAFSIQYVEYIYNLAMKQNNIDPNNIGIIFCGDFNSVPECGIYKLMTEQFVGKDFIDWYSNKSEAVTNVELKQPFKMASACGTPEFTNYTTLFSACLDYIFYQSDRFELLQSVPLPTNEQLSEHEAIPSVTFPSDHVALIADFKFKTSSSLDQ